MARYRLLLLIGIAGCGAATATIPPMPRMPFAADTLRSEILRPGIVRRFVWTAQGPWAIHILDVDLSQCYTPVAIKGAPGAGGRRKTSELLGELTNTHATVAAVNADFFLFTPAGVPQGAMIASGRVITGPGPHAVFAVTQNDEPVITTLTARGSVNLSSRRLSFSAWNRDAPNGLAYFDAGWGTVTDTASSVVEVSVVEGRVAQIDTSISGVGIPRDGFVMRSGRQAPDSLRSALLALRPGERAEATIGIEPFHPRHAVGGRPVLLRDSIVSAAVDTQGGAAFATARHPRTAVGITRSPRRLLLVVVDGRQPPYSAGMALRELADLMRALGARDALNLDGGGSTTMAYADRDSARTIRIANRPSDAQGERPVANALAIADRCALLPHKAR